MSNSRDTLYIELLKVMHFIAGKVPPAKWERLTLELQSFAPRDDDLSIFYVNLDCHLERRDHIETQLRGLGLPYQRVRGIKEPYGLMGCLKSHIKTLRLAVNNGSLWTVVFEDDFAFERSFDDVRNQISFVMNNSDLAPVWLFDWIVNGPQPLTYPAYHGVKQANGACNNTSGYMVRRDYLSVLLNTWEKALTNLVVDLRLKIEEKRADSDREIGLLWWYSPDSAWAPLQIRDYWLLFEPAWGTQQYVEFGSSLTDSYENFERTGYRHVNINEITTQIA